MRVDHLVTANEANEHCFFNALLAGRDVFLRNMPAHDLVLDRDAFATLVRMRLDNDVAVLTSTTGLFDQLAFAIGRSGDRLAIRDLRLARVRVHFELAGTAVA